MRTPLESLIGDARALLAEGDEVLASEWSGAGVLLLTQSRVIVGRPAVTELRLVAESLSYEDIEAWQTLRDDLEIVVRGRTLPVLLGFADPETAERAAAALRRHVPKRQGDVDIAAVERERQDRQGAVTAVSGLVGLAIALVVAWLVFGLSPRSLVVGIAISLLIVYVRWNRRRDLHPDRWEKRRG